LEILRDVKNEIEKKDKSYYELVGNLSDNLKEEIENKERDIER
jgi:hypothetical protein